MQNDAHHIEFQGSARELGDDEERGPGGVGAAAETAVEIGIDGGEVEPVVERQKHECHHKITDNKAEASLHIGHLRVQHHARNAHKRDTRHRCPNHAKCHKIPRRLPVAAKKRVVAFVTSGVSTYDVENGKVDEYYSYEHGL